MNLCFPDVQLITASELDFRLPPSLSISSYPAHKPNAPYSFQHQLTLIARLFLLQTVPQLTSAERASFVAMLEPNAPSILDQFPNPLSSLMDDPDCPVIDSSPMSAFFEAGQSAPGVRLIGEKVLAVPGQLSQGEYSVLAQFLTPFCGTLAWSGRSDGFARWGGLQGKWSALSVIYLMAKECPRLMEAV